jgi:hypothetical protein
MPPAQDFPHQHKTPLLQCDDKLFSLSSRVVASVHKALKCVLKSASSKVLHASNDANSGSLLLQQALAL